MNLFKRKKKVNTKIESYAEIERTRTLKGRYVPSFINNGGNYFFVNLQVFEDGLVDCWELLDLELFKKKINSGWVSQAIPNGKAFSIHHLGSWEVKDGNWLFNQDSFYEHVVSVIKSLNPQMQNLHNCHGKTTEKFGKINKSILGLANGKPVKSPEPEDYFSKKCLGDDFHALIKTSENEYSLVNINVYSDSSIELSGIEQPELITTEEFKNRVTGGTITTEMPENAKLTIYGFGECTVGECHYFEDINDKTSEISDIVAKLNGQKTSSNICQEIYDEYCKTPTVKLKEKLKTAYENIPDHLRRYVLGDMDRKDMPVRMIIYGDQEIEKWSHYQISKQEGLDLPHIEVPKPVDQDE